jgi:signal transduction histidine kinase
MLAPLKVAGRTIGALGVGRIEPHAGFAPGDAEQLRDLADRAALALENARLYDAAQNAIRLRDEFISIASHELKTPLTPLQLQVQNLQRIAEANAGQVPPERLRTFAAVTERQVQRLAGLVNSLLDVSRIGAGKFELEPEAFDFVAAVREVLERFALEAERAGSELRLHAPASVVGAWDRMRIEQVITNLISNALKYGDHKPVDVHCTLTGGQVELRVIDHGIGLPADFTERAFERFSRAVSTRSYAGLGLGLYIVKQIVLAHGGVVSAACSAEGTTFTVRLPLSPPFGRPPPGG